MASAGAGPAADRAAAAAGDAARQPAAPRPVVTRFAPSPTGYLHIGGARTALFNWLFARARGGTYLLRIEDTDRQRSTQPAIDAIHDGLAWLGLLGDAPAVMQFARSARHAEVAEALLAAGHAYRCYLTAEELAERRAAAQAERRPYRLTSEWRDADPATAPAGQPHVVRIKAPRTGETTIDDLVQGPVTVQNAEIDDFVLLRSDGTPTYMLAVVVDDHDMGITHVIRGDDHLNNAFRQLAIIRAMAEVEGGWPVPEYAHIPLIHGADGAKLSKRHGALGVDAYRDALGMLPEAVFNYLLRLSWGHGDAEIISREQAIEWFDIRDVGKAPARFDMAKLANLNAHYLREADDRRLAELVAPNIEKFLSKERDRIDGALFKYMAGADVALLTRAMPVLKPRAADLNVLAASAAFLFAQRPINIDAKAAALLTAEARALLADIYARLGATTDWTITPLETTLKAMAEEHGLGLGKLAQPLRAALTGQSTSPGIFDVLVLLGKEESLARIAAQAAPHEPGPA